MSRLGKYMVYNPLKGKPIKYYKNYTKALADALILREKEGTDILVLEVVTIADTKRTSITDGIKSKYQIELKLTVDGVENES